MSDRKTIVFDGVCVLCSGWVRFVIARDRRAEFSFAAMQSATGRALLEHHGIDPDDPVTFLLIDNGAAYTDTDAALRIVSRFGFHWKYLASVARWIPTRARNLLYRWIARNRYRIFGRTEICFVPAASERDRFLS